MELPLSFPSDNQQQNLGLRPSLRLEFPELDYGEIYPMEGYVRRIGKKGWEWKPPFAQAVSIAEIKILISRSDTNSHVWTPTTYAFIVPTPDKPVSSSEEGILLDLRTMDIEKLYDVEYGGEKYAIRLTEDGSLELYEVEEIK